MTRILQPTALAVLVSLLATACGTDDKAPVPVRPTATATRSPSHTREPTLTATPRPTATPTAVPTQTASATPSASATATRTATASPTATAAAPTPTATPATPTPTASPSPTETPAVPMLFRAPALTEPAGPRADGSGVLPNGRIVIPTGEQIPVDTLPFNLRLTPSGHLVVTNDGFGNVDFQRHLLLIDPRTRGVTRTPSTHLIGLAVSPDGSRVYVANGPNDRVDVFALADGALTPLPDEAIAFPAGTFPLGIDLGPDGRRLYVSGFLNNGFWRVDLATRTLQRSELDIGNYPYGVVVSRDERTAWVTSWGINNGNPGNLVPVPLPPTDVNADSRSSVGVVDLTRADAPRFARYIPVGRNYRIDNRRVFGGSHPSAMALSPDGSRLYVTATNVDTLAVIDTATQRLLANVDLNVFGDGLQGLYPMSIAVAPDGQRLYVADAGINAVQVLDVRPDGSLHTRGFIPTGWYPSALALAPDGRTLYVANAKGTGVGPNGAELVDINRRELNETPYYIGRLLTGQVSIIDLDAVDLDAGTAAVRARNGFDPVPATAEDLRNPVPIDYGYGPSAQIEHVVFILKENRTYDQIFGAFEGGNGDPRLMLFGEDVTPNHYALARQFAMGDNFYNDGDVSYPGHEWVTQGNNNDWVEKIWPFEYNGLLDTSYNIEAGMEGFARNGYIFEALQRQNIPLRVYGEPLAFNSRFAAGIDGRGVPSTLRRLLDAFGSIENLVNNIGTLLAGDIPALEAAGVNVAILKNEIWPHLMLDYPSNILPDKTDVFRAELFIGELERFIAGNNLPRFIFMWLPNDHTFGAEPRQPTPRSAVADNDRALGLVVEALSKSPFWNRMAIFVTEDDCQDGQDHVSAHRTIALVISPWVKRGYVSRVHHSNVSMLKTMLLLLGAEPMAQFDRYATDMRDYFTLTPDYTPYTAVAARVRPASNPEPERAPNRHLAEAARVSERIDLDGYDEAGPELSRVLWLVHVGEQVERDRRRATALVWLLGASLLAGGALARRRRPAAAGGGSR